jgi:hypothetical protein
VGRGPAAAGLPDPLVLDRLLPPALDLLGGHALVKDSVHRFLHELGAVSGP